MRAFVCIVLCSTAGALRLPPDSVSWSPAKSDGGFLLSVDASTRAAAEREPDTWLEPLVLETDARVFYVHNLLTPEECDHIIARAEPLLQRSTVVDGKGGGVVDSIRNSAGTFLNRRSDPVISKLNDRLSLLTQMPVSHQEDLQVLRYEPGQHYYPHTDWFSTSREKAVENGMQRWATILTYLNSYGEDYTGGETILPMFPEGKHQQNWTGVSSCTLGKLAVRPKKGDAVYFRSMNEAGLELTSSTHGSCDVISGVKFSAPTWVRQQAFHLQSLPPDGPVVCRDKNSNCRAWFEAGECTRNEAYMRADCAVSCGMCPPAMPS